MQPSEQAQQTFPQSSGKSSERLVSPELCLQQRQPDIIEEIMDEEQSTGI